MFKKTTAIRANVLRKTANNIRSIKYNTGMSTGEIIDHLMLNIASSDLASAVEVVISDILIGTSNLSWLDRDKVYLEIFLASLMSTQTSRGILDKMIQAGLEAPEGTSPHFTSEERFEAFKKLRKKFGLMEIPSDIKI